MTLVPLFEAAANDAAASKDYALGDKGNLAVVPGTFIFISFFVAVVVV